MSVKVGDKFKDAAEATWEVTGKHSLCGFLLERKTIHHVSENWIETELQSGSLTKIEDRKCNPPCFGCEHCLDSMIEAQKETQEIDMGLDVGCVYDTVPCYHACPGCKYSLVPEESTKE